MQMIPLPCLVLLSLLLSSSRSAEPAKLLWGPVSTLPALPLYIAAKGFEQRIWDVLKVRRPVGTIDVQHLSKST